MHKLKIKESHESEPDATGIETMEDVRSQMADVWYTLDGRRIANGQKPTAKGIYIHNGKKVIIR
jgi:hypothetical protein